MQEVSCARNSSIPFKRHLVCPQLPLSSRCGVAVGHKCVITGAEHLINSAVELASIRDSVGGSPGNAVTSARTYR
jgi:hypothetical protein